MHKIRQPITEHCQWDSGITAPVLAHYHLARGADQQGNLSATCDGRPGVGSMFEGASYSPSARLVTFRRASYTGRSAWLVTGTFSRSLFALRTPG